MKCFTRGLASFVLGLSMLVSAGCGTDNETEAEKLAKSIGDPGAASTKGAPTAPQAPPATEAERGQRMLDAQKNLPKGYPGPGSKR